MINLEQVEKLKEYGKVSYEDAKIALEATNGDMLEAVIYLEKLGKIESPKNNGSYTAGNQQEEEAKEMDSEDDYCNYTEDEFKEHGRKRSRRISNTIRVLINKGVTNYFEVKRYGNVIISVPVIALVVALVFFGITLPLMVIGLFFGCSYHFKGPDLRCDENPLNQAMDAAKETAEQVKTAFSENKR
ncbi:MAG: DUF4342 domain-containing protein [Filifactoraceae bacterium]